VEEDKMKDVPLTKVNTHERKDDIIMFIAAQRNPDKFRAFVDQLIPKLKEHFGDKSKIHMSLYRNGDFTGYQPKYWEMLFHVEMDARPDVFAELLTSFECSGFNKNPVDVCRFKRKGSLMY
jgi:hypothetical protein